jgi:hypothetical protein
MPEKEPEPVELVLDVDSFNWAERLECQQRFDNEWGDILKYLRALVNPGREGAMPFRLFDRRETLIVGDQLLAFLLWVQARRDRPDAELAEFEGLAPGDLRWAHLNGLLARGKARKDESVKSKPSSRRRASSSSSAEG